MEQVLITPFENEELDNFLKDEEGGKGLISNIYTKENRRYDAEKSKKGQDFDKLENHVKFMMNKLILKTLPNEHKEYTKIVCSNLLEIANNGYVKYDGYYRGTGTYIDSEWDGCKRERVYFNKEYDKWDIHYDIGWDENSLGILLDDNTFLEIPNGLEVITDVANVDGKKILFFDQGREIGILESNNEINLIKRPKCIYRFDSDEIKSLGNGNIKIKGKIHLTKPYGTDDTFLLLLNNNDIITPLNTKFTFGDIYIEDGEIFVDLQEYYTKRSGDKQKVKLEDLPKNNTD